ncbi:LOW QUALITY PROTEIN: hypothetical protein V1477_006659 [Vespula maculifrons]|uniref:Uncharacterized protein n=1 Tax=Vespula maculifrons TaxID=7453 RepID=A0ABD2CJI1_VESMC
MLKKHFFSFVPLKPLLLGSYWADQVEKNMGRAPRALSNDLGPVTVGAIVSEEKLLKRNFLFSLFPLKRYNSAPIGPMWTKKIWALRARRALSSDPGPVLLGEPFFSFVAFKQLLLGSYWADQVEKNMGLEGSTSPFQCLSTGGCREPRVLSNDPGPLLLGAIVSEKKIVKEKLFFPLCPLNRYNSAAIGPMWTKKIWALRARRAQSNHPGRVLLGAIVSEKKIVKEKCFLPLFHLKRYNSAPIGAIWTKKICADRRALSNDPGPVLLGAIVSEQKIVKEKCFFPMFPLNSYNSAPTARRALSNDPGRVLLGAIVSEKKIIKENVSFLLLPLNRFNSAPIGPMWTEKIWALRARRALSSDPGPVLVVTFFSFVALKPLLLGSYWADQVEKNMGLEGSTSPFQCFSTEKLFFPLCPLNRYNSAAVGPMWTKKIWALRARRTLSNDPRPVAVGIIVSERKIIKEKLFFPLCPLNRHNSAPIEPILTKNVGREPRALSNDLGTVTVGAIVSEEKFVITRLLLVRSRRKKLGSRGRDEPFPVTPVRFT